MAIILEKESPATGATGDYWRIVSVNVSRNINGISQSPSDNIVVYVDCFKSASARESGKSPIFQKSFVFGLENLDPNVSLLESCYSLCMATDFFDGGVSDEVEE